MVGKETNRLSKKIYFIDNAIINALPSEDVYKRQDGTYSDGNCCGVFCEWGKADIGGYFERRIDIKIPPNVRLDIRRYLKCSVIV